MSHPGVSRWFEDPLRRGHRWRPSGRERYVPDSPTPELQLAYTTNGHEGVDALASRWFEGPLRRSHRWRSCSRERCISDSPTQGLEQAYVIDDREAVDAFVQSNPFVFAILREAPAALNIFFGPNAKRILRIAEDDEGTRTLFCFVAFDGHLSEAMRALKSFDENWWLERCAWVAGRLNFDFELV